MYNYFNCNVDFLIVHSAMVELEIVAIISKQKEKALQNQPPMQKTMAKKKKYIYIKKTQHQTVRKSYDVVIKIAPSLYSPKLRI